MPPVGVGVQQLANKPVVITSEYIAVIKSRRSSDVRPQVEGVITDIFAKSGDRVTAGKPLLQIDASKQQATVESDEASRIAQDEAVHYSGSSSARQAVALGWRHQPTECDRPRPL
jgi:multidrug efflux pump subunit AcrA (membrane-fusion protein)